jgi:hypothetical protein
MGVLALKNLAQFVSIALVVALLGVPPPDELLVDGLGAAVVGDGVAAGVVL